MKQEAVSRKPIKRKNEQTSKSPDWQVQFSNREVFPLTDATAIILHNHQSSLQNTLILSFYFFKKREKTKLQFVFLAENKWRIISHWAPAALQDVSSSGHTQSRENNTSELLSDTFQSSLLQLPPENRYQLTGEQTERQQVGSVQLLSDVFQRTHIVYNSTEYPPKNVEMWSWLICCYMSH